MIPEIEEITLINPFTGAGYEVALADICPNDYSWPVEAVSELSGMHDNDVAWLVAMHNLIGSEDFSAIVLS